MKDERGLYYMPYPQNPQTRMYVRRGSDDIYFRLWNAKDPKLWEEHDWVPWGAIRKASAMYARKGAFDPIQAYDIRVAEALLAENE
jgi:hypothetical protein